MEVKDHKFKRVPYFKHLRLIISKDNDLKIELCIINYKWEIDDTMA